MYSFDLNIVTTPFITNFLSTESPLKLADTSKVVSAKDIYNMNEIGILAEFLARLIALDFEKIVAEKNKLSDTEFLLILKKKETVLEVKIPFGSICSICRGLNNFAQGQNNKNRFYLIMNRFYDERNAKARIIGLEAIYGEMQYFSLMVDDLYKYDMSA